MARRYVLQTFKAAGGRTDRGMWSNIYNLETQQEQNVSSVAMANLVGSIVNAEKAMYLESVSIMRAVLHSADADHNPIPDQFTVATPSLIGERQGGDDPLPVDIGLEVAKQPLTGRAARMLFRGSLREDDADGNPALGYTLNPGSRTYFEGALDDLLSAVANGGARIIIRADPNLLTWPNPTAINSLRVQGITVQRRSRDRQSIEQARLALARREINIQVRGARRLIEAFGSNPLLWAATALAAFIALRTNAFVVWNALPAELRSKIVMSAVWALVE